MLFSINNSHLTQINTQTLKSIGLKEKDLEQLLFANLGKVLRQTELFPFTHSRQWQEEADLLALDKNGNLYIFELKAWESKRENLLQVMRYAQICFQYDYQKLDHLHRRYNNGKNLQTDHQNFFSLENPLDEREFNNKQNLIVMTNGLDSATRQAVQYWKEKGVQISPWIYRIYNIDNQSFISFEALGTTDDPYEDIPSKFHIVNTCAKESLKPHEHMLANKRASAFYSPWKDKITNIKKSDIVFLYKNGEGIVAYGRAKNSYKSAAWQGDADEEYYVELEGFKILTTPISHTELKEIVEYPITIIGTHTTIRPEGGDKLITEVQKRTS